jgi:hypothetical protein
MGGWNAHLHLRMEDPITKRRLKWQLDGLFAAVDLSAPDRKSIPVCYVHDAEVASAEKFLLAHVPAWRSLAVSSRPLGDLLKAVENQPALLVVSRTPERSVELHEALAQMRLALPPRSAPLVFLDHESLDWAASEPVALVWGQPRQRTLLPDIWAKLFGSPWQAGIWQLNGDPLAAPDPYTRK